jgi:RNA polymerase sigma factor (sigma-70 family)
MAAWWRRLVMRALLTRSFSHGSLAKTVPPSPSSCAAMDSMFAVLHLAFPDKRQMPTTSRKMSSSCCGGGRMPGTQAERHSRPGSTASSSIAASTRRDAGGYAAGCPFGKAADPIDDAPDAYAALAGREHLEEMRHMIRMLPDKQRLALLLAVQGERSNAEIGSILGISEGAAEQLLVRARRTLREKIKEKESAQ